MSEDTVLQRIIQCGVMPIISIDKAEAALPLADALLEGGLPIIEITFRTAVAAQVIATVAKARPNLLVGAGTVLTTASLDAAKKIGAAFAVAPGLNPEVVKHARKIGFPFFPGVATPSDIEAGLAFGCSVLKFFPAEALGGVGMIEALSAPFRHTGLRFLPSGGINPANFETYLKLDTVAAVGGTWLARKEDVSAGNWPKISSLCRQAVEAVVRARTPAKIKTRAPSPG